MITATLKEYFKKTDWFMPYKKFSYFHPTRIETSAPAGNLYDMDNGQFFAQLKFNGNSCMVFTNGTELHVYDRHASKFTKQNVPQHEKDGSFSYLYSETVGEGLQPGKWMVLVGEYMLKSKVDETGENWNNNFVVFDILAYDGYLLYKSTFDERQLFLDALYGTNDALGAKSEVLYRTPVARVYRAKRFYEDFAAIYAKWSEIDMIEGLVLKQRDAGLQPLVGEKNNSLSQLKFRKPTKNYKY
jgi:ATP-dependent DNA ligase